MVLIINGGWRSRLTEGDEMTAQATTPRMSRAQMDALVDGHYRAEEAGDLEAIVDGFTPDAEHDIAGSSGDVEIGRASCRERV